MNDSAAMKEGEVGVGGDTVGGLCVCECVKICVCVPEDCSCWRWWWGGVWRRGGSTSCQRGQPTLSKITYSTPDFPSSLLQAKLS